MDFDFDAFFKSLSARTDFTDREPCPECLGMGDDWPSCAPCPTCGGSGFEETTHA